MRRRLSAATAAFVGCAALVAATAPGSYARTESQPTPAAPQPYIVNGSQASIRQFPWYSAVLNNEDFSGTAADRFYCGGSVVAPQLVLTAAHCTYSAFDGRRLASSGGLSVLVGCDDLNAPCAFTNEVRVDNIIRYAYDPVSGRGDLALLHLEVAVNAPPVSIVPAQSDYRWSAGRSALIDGIGCQQATPDGRNCAQYPTRLRKATLPIMSDSSCAARFARYNAPFDASAMLCAGSPSATLQAPGPCFGDSGGGLTVAGPSGRLLVGIVSWGIACGGEPTAFTRVASYRTWLLDRGVPLAPQPFAFGATRSTVKGANPIAGDFNGDGSSDLLLYRAGQLSDPVLRGSPNDFVAGPVWTINGSYRAASCVADASVSTKAFVLLHGPGLVPDLELQFGQGSPFSVSRSLVINGSYIPLLADFDGGGTCDLFLYAPGAADDLLLLGDGQGHFSAAKRYHVNGLYRPAVGDFNGDGRADILWYAPGRPLDPLWYGAIGGFTAGPSRNVTGVYAPITGDFNADGFADILWYGAGHAPDALWFSSPTGFHAPKDVTVSGTYIGTSGDVNGDGRADVTWYDPAAGTVTVWHGR